MAENPRDVLSAWRAVIDDVNGLATERTPISTAVPRLLKAVEVALSFHRPVQLYALDTECGHDIDAGDWPQHFEGDDGEWYCRDKPVAVACSGCPGSPDGEYADHPCAEYAAILAALTGKEESDGG